MTFFFFCNLIFVHFACNDLWERVNIMKSIFDMCKELARKTVKVKIKANHLVYSLPRWYRNRTYADCQQKWLSLEHDTGWRTLLVTFLENSRGSTALRDKHLWHRACISLLIFTFFHCQNIPEVVILIVQFIALL